MRVLVVGGGGREHAIVDALRQSGAEIYAAMANQNPGIRRASKDILLVNVTAVDDIVRWASAHRVELAVIGPEGPLEKGIVDALESAAIPTVGPSRAAAQLETNKEFTRELMRDQGIPGAPRFWAFDDLASFEKFVSASDFEFVIKPLGLTGGKGVRVWGDHFTTKEGALAYGKEILTEKIGGVARFLVEEKLVGEEFSLQAFCDGHTLAPMPLAQDHKRAYEGDKGPNTGGMGSYSDADHLLQFLTPKDFEGALETMHKTVAAMAARGTPFKGILYGGFMATKDGPRLLEFNVRFADPESMNVLPILEERREAVLCERRREGRPFVHDDFSVPCHRRDRGQSRGCGVDFRRGPRLCRREFLCPPGHREARGHPEEGRTDAEDSGGSVRARTSVRGHGSPSPLPSTTHQRNAYASTRLLLGRVR